MIKNVVRLLCLCICLILVPVQAQEMQKCFNIKLLVTPNDVNDTTWQEAVTQIKALVAYHDAHDHDKSSECFAAGLAETARVVTSITHAKDASYDVDLEISYSEDIPNFTAPFKNPHQIGVLFSLHPFDNTIDDYRKILDLEQEFETLVARDTTQSIDVMNNVLQMIFNLIQGTGTIQISGIKK